METWFIWTRGFLIGLLLGCVMVEMIYAFYNSKRSKNVPAVRITKGWDCKNCGKFNLDTYTDECFWCGQDRPTE